MVSWEEILFRLFLAALFGALIGLERERKDWTGRYANTYDGKPWFCPYHAGFRVWIFWCSGNKECSPWSIPGGRTGNQWYWFHRRRHDFVYAAGKNKRSHHCFRLVDCRANWPCNRWWNVFCCRYHYSIFPGNSLGSSTPGKLNKKVVYKNNS